MLQSATGVLQSAAGVLQIAAGVLQSAAGVLQSVAGVLQSAECYFYAVKYKWFGIVDCEEICIFPLDPDDQV